MGSAASTLVLKEPPEDWGLEEYDSYINHLVSMYRYVGLFMKMQDEGKFNAAEELHEIIWTFRDARLEKFPQAKDNWMLVDL